MLARTPTFLHPRRRPFEFDSWLILAVWTTLFVIAFLLTVPSLGRQSAIFGLVYIGLVAWFYGTSWALGAILFSSLLYPLKFGPVSDIGNILGIALEVGIALGIGWVSQLYSKLKATEERLREEHQKSELLLGNIFPRKIVERLKNGEVMIADRYPETTLLFSDLVGFTDLTRVITPTELVQLLDKLITGFDGLSERFRIEKIKTIGDAYLVVSGLPEENANHAIDICRMALAMQAFVKDFNEREGFSLQIRIGINSGPVIGGVIGPKKFTFDLWGDTVNMASRLETNGIPGQIQVAKSTWELTKHRFRFEPRPPIDIKGIGTVQTYFLLGPIEQPT